MAAHLIIGERAGEEEAKREAEDLEAGRWREGMPERWREGMPERGREGMPERGREVNGRLERARVSIFKSEHLRVRVEYWNFIELPCSGQN